MKIRKNDIVLVTKGKYRGKKGKVLRAMPKKDQLIVEGVNILKKHAKPQKTGEKGKMLEITGSIFISNVKLICKKCKKAAKTGYKFVTKKDKQVKIRICKKCEKET